MADLIYFRTLGRLELTRGSAPLPLLRRPRKLALFTVLALSRSPFRSRDSLQAMFWLESDQDHARKSLNTAVHALRQDLGADAVVSRGDDEIGVAADLVWSDVRAFDEAVAEGNVKQALVLYGGDLMEGFFVPGAPGFEHWLDGERARLRRAAHGTAWQLAERAERTGDIDAAAEWARRAVEVLFDDEPSVRRSISLLDRAGDRMGAIQMYERFAHHLQEEFSAKPAPETRRVIAKILARDEPHALPERPHDRRIGPVQRQVQPAEPREAATDAASLTASPPATETPTDAPAPVIAELPSPPQTLASAARGARRRFASRRVPSVLAAAAAVAVVVVGLWFTRRLSVDVRASDEPRIEAQPAPDPSSRPRIVISQFETLGGDLELAFLASAITAALTQQLAEVRAIEVITEEAYARSVNTAARLKVRTTSAQFFLVRGSVLPSPERVRVGIELIDANSGNVLRSAMIDRPAVDVFRLIDEVAQQVGTLLRTALGREIRLRRWRAGTTSVPALELLHRAEVDRRRAGALQEGGSVAVAALLLGRADSLLALAEREDPEWADPIVWRAQVASDAGWLYSQAPLQDTARAREWIESGIAHAGRVLARDSTHATALELRGTLYYWASFMTVTGEIDAAPLLRQAENDLRGAVSADMERARAGSLLSAILFARGDFTDAYATAERAYQADAYLENRDDILTRLALTAHEIGNDSLAWHWCSIVTAEGAGRLISGYYRLHLLAWGDERHTRPPLDPWTIMAEIGGAPAAQAMQPHFEMLAATVLARRGLADSARAVAARAAPGYPDEELLLFEAGARVALGDHDSAATLLRRYVTGDPALRYGTLRTRRFAALDSLLGALRPDGRR